MAMLTPCETVMKGFLPAMKVAVARELHEKHGFQQTEIARSLGLTQAAVSKYLTGSVSPRIKALASNDTVRKLAEEAAGRIAAERGKKIDIVEEFCKSCLNFSKINCEFRELEKNYKTIFEVLRKDLNKTA